MKTITHRSLHGKLLYAFGTSIVNGHLANVSFVEDIATANHMDYRKYCINGASTRFTGPNNIPLQVENAPQITPDLIVFDSYANDAYAEVTDDPAVLGAITEGFDAELDPHTYCGGLEKVCRLLLTKYQGAKILYVATHKTPARDLRVQTILHDLSLKIMQKWSIKVCDLFTEGNLNAFVGTYQHDYSYDKLDDHGGNHSVGGSGTHPNADGYQLFYDPAIAAGLASLV